jgi:hypothetical protein
VTKPNQRRGAFLALVTAVMGAVLGAGFLLSPASAATSSTYHYKTLSRSSCPTAAGCATTELKIQAQVKYNNSKVYVTQGPSCVVDHSYGLAAHIDWCGVINNGGANTGQLSVGMNYTLSFVHNGVPLTQSYYLRIDVTRYGNVTYRGCYHLC